MGEAWGVTGLKTISGDLTLRLGAGERPPCAEGNCVFMAISLPRSPCATRTRWALGEYLWNNHTLQAQKHLYKIWALSQETGWSFSFRFWLPLWLREQSGALPCPCPCPCRCHLTPKRRKILAHIGRTGLSVLWLARNSISCRCHVESNSLHTSVYPSAVPEAS